jgi:hypothetical protein
MRNWLGSEDLWVAVASATAIFASGCVPSITLTSVRNGRDVQFDFGGDVSVYAIAVQETGVPPNASPACGVAPAVPLDSAPHSRGWTYGHALSPQIVPKSPCAPLTPGRSYDIRVYHSGHCITSEGFRVSSDGSIQRLGPPHTGCWM